MGLFSSSLVKYNAINCRAKRRFPLSHQRCDDSRKNISRSCNSNGWIRTVINENSLAILRPVKSSENAEFIRKSARMIVDTLNTEALTQVQLSYSSVIESLTELSGAFRETSLALKVGKLFYPEQTIFPYNELGVGRLIYQLPVSLCENFLKEIFGENVPDELDEETAVTINRFFQNNLNIAETSRQLHMHRNTLIYRLEQIQKRTGLDLRIFEDAMVFKIATMVMNYLHTERNS